MADISNDIDVCNIALGHLGKPSITAYGDGSSEGKLCLRYYDFSRKLALRRSPWTFARTYAALASVTNDLSSEWDFAYDLPSASIKLRRVVDPAVGIERNAPPIPFFISNGNIYCNVDTAWVEYTGDSTDVAAWSDDFKDAVALQIAYRISPTFIRRRSDRKELLNEYEFVLGNAIETDAAQEPEIYTQNTEGYTRARGSGGSSRYDGLSTDNSSFWS